MVVQQGEVDGGAETAKRMISAWQNPIHNKSGKELQMTMRIQGNEKEGEKPLFLSLSPALSLPANTTLLVTADNHLCLVPRFLLHLLPSPETTNETPKMPPLTGLSHLLPHTTPSDHHLPLLRRSSSSSSLMLVSPNLGAVRSRGSENSLRNRAKRKNRIIRAVETSTGPLETSTSNSSSSSQFEKLNGPSKSLPSARRGVSSGVGDVSKEIKRVRAQMEENEQLAILMRGLRGQNLTDSQFADDNIQLRLVEVCCLYLCISLS
ncbi:hypothetical protein Cgig2_004490 [Carnegiea gigantea]|uniref:Uncharacterized protein n=1 Tax=Carnegiea gigantea TaxID=171969 RepID=A0A9Q1Q632_9CARY|nr:hypothetical protein Cgig2_004490 [Carnegiea gigantea]